MKWKEITQAEFNKLFCTIKYRIMAGGNLLRHAGKFAEFTPYSALNSRYPDLRIESFHGTIKSKYFKFE